MFAIYRLLHCPLFTEDCFLASVQSFSLHTVCLSALVLQVVWFPPIAYSIDGLFRFSSLGSIHCILYV